MRESVSPGGGNLYEEIRKPHSQSQGTLETNSIQKLLVSVSSALYSAGNVFYSVSSVLYSVNSELCSDGNVFYSISSVFYSQPGIYKHID